MASLLGFKKKVSFSQEEKLKNAIIRRKLNQEFSKTVKKLQMRHAETNETFYSSDVTDSLCCLLEAVFLHGLKDSSSQSYWKFVSKFTHSDVITQIKNLKQISSEIGYCRVWVRVALNDGLMESYVHSMIQDKDTLCHHYTQVAYLRDLEAPGILQGILTGMQNLEFKLSTNSTVLNLWPREPLVLAGYLEQQEHPVPVIRESPGPEADAMRSHSGSQRSVSSTEETTASPAAASAANPSISVDPASPGVPADPGPPSLKGNSSSRSLPPDTASVRSVSSDLSAPLSLQLEMPSGARSDQALDHSDISSLGSSPPEEDGELAVHVGSERRRKGRRKRHEHEHHLHHHHHSSGLKAEGADHRRSLEGIRNTCEEKTLESGGGSPKEKVHLSVRESSNAVVESSGRRGRSRSPKGRRKSPMRAHNAHSHKKEESNVSDVNRTPTVSQEGDLCDQEKVKASKEQGDETREKDIVVTDSQVEIPDDSIYARSEDLDTTVLDYRSLFPSCMPKEGHSLSVDPSQKDSTPTKSPSSPSLSRTSREGKVGVGGSHSETGVKMRTGAESQQSPESSGTRAKSSASVSDLRRASVPSTSSSPSPPDSAKGRRSSGCPGLRAKGDPISSAASPVPGDQLEAAGVQKSKIGSVREELRQGSVRRGSKPAVDPILHGSPVIGNSLNSRQGWSSSFEAEYNHRHPSVNGDQDLASTSPPGGAVGDASHSKPTADPTATDDDVEQHEEAALDLSQIAQESSLASQNMKCHGCAAPIGYIYGDPLVCSLDGHSYCSQCHQGDEALIPAFILHNWDFKKYPVSQANYRYLQEVYDTAEFNLEEVSPGLYDIIPALEEVKELRMQLRYLKTYLYTCKESIASELRRKVWPKEYLYLEPDLYSVSDLLNVISGQLAKQLREIIKFATKHVYRCPLCSERGFICELCHNPKIIYPFEIETTFRCEDCSAVYHRACKTERIPCPKCQRRQKMAMRSIPRRGSSAFDMDYAYSPEHDA